jgi:hypothetical protein
MREREREKDRYRELVFRRVIAENKGSVWLSISLILSKTCFCGFNCQEKEKKKKKKNLIRAF